MAIRSDGVRRIAFEVQSAGMTVPEGQVRTDRSSTDGIETIRVTTNHARWAHKLPSMRVVNDDRAGWMVDRGTAAWEQGRWKGGARSSLGNVVGGMSTSSLVRHEVRGLTELIVHRTGTVRRDHDHAIALVSAKTLVCEDQFEGRRMVERAERGRHERRIEELGHRQAAVLPAPVGDAFLGAGAGQAVFVGVPGVRVLSGRIPDLLDAVGSGTTAFGVVIWIGSRRRRRLFSVGSPVAGRLGPGLVGSWAGRGIECTRPHSVEKQRLERVLGTAVRVREATSAGPVSPRPSPRAVSPGWSSDSRG